jgi:hypothetical protein
MNGAFVSGSESRGIRSFVVVGFFMIYFALCLCVHICWSLGSAFSVFVNDNGSGSGRGGFHDLKCSRGVSL